MTRAHIELAVIASLEDRARVFERMAAEGRAGIVQYSLPRPSLAAWMEGTAPDRAWLCVMKDADGNEGAAVWITDFMGRSALYNFVVFRGFGHVYREFCHASCRWAFSGGLACLVGITPSVNRAALAAMRGSGWREAFRIPQACFMARLGRHVDGIVSRCTPEILCEATS